VDGALIAIMSESTDHIVVVGGGISGLAAAHHLLQTVPEARVTLLEAEARLGGKIVTERRDGFVIEGGPDSFLAAKPRGVGLSEDVGLGDCLQGVTPRERRAFVLFRGRLHDLPEGLTGLVPTRLAPLARSTLLSPAGKARVALDYALPAQCSAGDESLGGFIRRRLGREAWERLVEPLMAGIYAADGDQLSLAATFPQLRQAERDHGGLIRGVLAARRVVPSVAPPRSAFLTPVGGMDELVTELANRLQNAGATVRTSAPVTAVTPSAAGYCLRLATGEAIDATAVILAAPAFVAADLVIGFAPALAAELGAIPHASTAIVTLAFGRHEIGHPLDGHGYVVPRIEGGPILACTWSSRKWAHRAPAGWELIRVFVGRAGREDALTGDDASLVALARRELAVRLGVTAAPAFTRAHRWPRGMPQYLLGHPERIARVESALAEYPGLFLAGNAYRGVGIPDCIASGERAAAAAGDFVNRHYVDTPFPSSALGMAATGSEALPRVTSVPP
jgi:protoporphyrinogen/coproporphyrinogen III oxidase